LDDPSGFSESFAVFFESKNDERQNSVQLALCVMASAARIIFVGLFGRKDSCFSTPLFPEAWEESGLLAPP